MASAEERRMPPAEAAFLFTDIEGSTAIWEREPEAMRAALATHDAIVGDAIAGAGGAIVKHTGDGFMAVFASAGDACLAAVTAQRKLAEARWPTSMAIRVRMSVHSGEAFERDGDYFGPTLNRCARLMSIAHGGQVVTSKATWQSIMSSARVDVSGRALGRHRLKGLAEPEDVVQIVTDGLGVDFPPLQSAISAATNLVAPRTTFIGRDRETKRLHDLLASAQIVTLVGPGGVGKSRIALEVARSMQANFIDGVFIVDVAAVGDATRLADEIADAVRVPGEGRAVTWEMSLAYLATRELLLVLNDCEHVIDAVADVVDNLLDVAHAVKLIVTSREPLNVEGEHVVAVEPLDDAPALFVDRALAVGATVPSDDQTALVIRELCDRVDNLPLAIELLSSHARSLSPSQLLADLDRSLSTSRRGRGARWSNLDDTIAWSYSLLDGQLRGVLQALSTIPGAFSSGCAARVIGSPGGTEYSSLAQLVGKSLLVAVPDAVHGEQRYRMLQTIRDHVSSRVPPADAATHRRKLRAWALEHVRAPAVVRCHDTAHALELETDLDALRGALGSAVVESRDALVPLVMGMTGVWWMLNRGEEGLRWISEIDERDITDGEHLAVYIARAASLMASARLSELVPTLVEGAERARTTDRDNECAAMMLAFFAVAHLTSWEEGLRVTAEARAADTRGEWAPFIDHVEADLALSGDQFDQAIRLYGRAFKRYGSGRFLWWEVAASAGQAVGLHLVGKDEVALEVGRKALAIAARNPDLFAASSRATVVAVPLAALGRMSQAVDTMEDVLDACAERRHILGIAGEPIVGVAALASQAGLGDQCSALLELARRSREHVRSPWQYALYRFYRERSGSVPAPSAYMPVQDPIDVARSVLDDVRKTL
jgi:predicted ATPase/class 3 adenylate cyclase